MISPSMRLKWYKRKDVQEHIVENADNKEIAVKFGDDRITSRIQRMCKIIKKTKY